MASKEKLQSSVCSALFRNVNVPAPDADGPWSYKMAADVELVTTTAPSIDITITSSGNVLLPFMVLLLGVARKQRPRELSKRPEFIPVESKSQCYQWTLFATF